MRQWNELTGSRFVFTEVSKSGCAVRNAEVAVLDQSKPMISIDRKYSAGNYY